MKKILFSILLSLTPFPSLTIQAKTVFIYSNYDQSSFDEEKEAFIRTKEEFFKAIFGANCSLNFTPTLEALSDFEYLITLEVPHQDKDLSLLRTYPKEKLLLFSFASSINEPCSHNQDYHEFYSKVFTCDDKLIDDKKYFRIFEPWCDPILSVYHRHPSFEQRKLCVLIGSYRINHHPLDNYRLRYDSVDFFEKLHSKEFNFYGIWDIPHTGYQTYEGVIPLEGEQNYVYSKRLNKINTLSYYKFDLCYEKSKDTCLTERIFDSFAAGCVPVYSGSPFITKYIPQSCFIQRDNFRTEAELYAFLKKMTKKEFEIYRTNIQTFLTNEAASHLTTKYLIEKMRPILNQKD